MIPIFGSLLPDSREVLVVALDVALKAAALLIPAFALHAALGRRRALVRSALWNACLVGLLLLPAAGPALPRVSLKVLPTPGAIPSAVESPTPPQSAPPARPSIDRFFPVLSNGNVTPTAVPTRGIEISQPSSISAPAKIDASPIRVWRLDPLVFVVGAYLLIAALLILRLFASLAAVGRLLRRCEPVEEPFWVDGLERWRTTLGIARRVALRWSDRVSVPIVVGCLRPTIILPRTLVGTESRGLVDAVLLHELAHVRRGDFGWNLVHRLVRALYWPHPLVWPLGRILGSVREQACDDLCVHVLGGPDGYRASLIEVASGLVRRPGPSLGLAMARPTALARRLAWIDRSRGASRCLLRWPARLALAAAILAIASVIGSIELARSTAQASQEPAQPDNKDRAERKPGEGSKAVPDGPESVEVLVLARDTGKPLKGARVRTFPDYRFNTLTTDREGKVRIDQTNLTFGESLNIDVWADGYVQQSYDFSQVDPRMPRIPSVVTIELLPGEETLGGRVVDEQGRPIAGVKVEVWGYLGAKKAQHESAYMVDATTDEQGQWRCRCFRSMTFAYLYLSHPDYLADDEFHPRRHGDPGESNASEPDEQPMGALRDFSDVQVLKRGVAVVGRILDEHGKPVPGAEVGWLEANGRHVFHTSMPTTRTDADGRFRFPHTRPGRTVLQVKAKGHAPELKPVDARDGIEPVTITLGPARTMSGRVVDTRGGPIPGAFVNIDTWRGYRALGVYLKTDEQGRFRCDEAPADSVLINASANGYWTELQRRVSPDEGEILLTLRKSLEISGTVRDDESSRRIERAEVQVGLPDPKSGAITWSRNSRAFVSQGRLQAGLDAEIAPEYRLRIKAKGYEPFESRTFRSDEGRVEFDVRLKKADEPPAVVVSGVVRRPDGTPLEGAAVTVAYPMDVRGRLPDLELQDGEFRPREEQATVKTDVEGRFSVSRVPDPEGRFYGLVVVHPDFYGEGDRAAFEANPTITVRPWGRVEGLARIGGRPGGRRSGTSSIGWAIMTYRTCPTRAGRRRMPRAGSSSNESRPAMFAWPDRSARAQI